MMNQSIDYSPGDRLAAGYGQFRNLYRRELKESGIVGSSFAFLYDGRVVGTEFYGLADFEKNQKTDENTIYHWASNTKPLTGIAIMQLRDQGRLKLDDPVVEHLPELKAVYNPFGSMSRITVRHLMNHTAGFREATFPWSDGFDWQPFEPPGYEQIRAMLPYTAIEFEPGSRFGYSNLGIVFLGRIIEKLTADDYEVYVDKNIFKPLEMHRSYFDTTPQHLIAHRAHSYYLVNGRRRPGRFDADTGITVSNGGLNAPVADMIKYLNFLIGSPAKQEIYDRVLARASLEEMFRPTVPAPTDANGNAGFSTDVGLIFFLDRRNGEACLGHGGDQNGFLSYIEFDPVRRAAWIMVFNTNILPTAGSFSGTDVYSRLRRAARQLAADLNS